MAGIEDVLAGLNVSSAVAAIIGAGALVASMYFASWLVDTVANFFDGPSAEQQEYAEGLWSCDYCGEAQEPDADCHFDGGGEMCGLCSRDDSRFTED
jgi:hypothetical protein